jgi:predicted component of type VI protein secretion system
MCLGRGPQEKMLIAAAVEIDIVEDGGSANDLYPSALAMQVKQLATNASKRKKMANLGQAHVDGSGAERVVDVILEDINAER